MSIILDPAIRYLPDDHQIFILHPGDGKRFYSDFIELSAVFLDIPGIKFDNAPDKNDQSLRNKLRMARRIGNWRRANSPKDRTPSRDYQDYAIMTESKEAPRFAYEVHDLYTEAKPGDMIIVPGKGYYSKVYFGEITEVFDPDFLVESRRYPLELIPARRVRWLQTNMTKGQFDRRLIRLLQNRQALIEVSADEDRREIYRYAYGDYVWKETSGNLIRVSKQEIDLNDLNRGVDLVNYFACQYIAMKAGHLDQFSRLSFHDAIETYYDKSLFGGVSVEIHSPGYFDRPMRDIFMAGYVSAMVALSMSDATAAEISQIQVRNSANSIVSICDTRLESDIREVMEMYANMHLWERDVCPKGMAAKANLGLETDVKVQATPSKETN